MLEVVLEIPFWLELIAVFACSVLGSVAAVKEKYDVFGTVAIGLITGLGGGILRDLLLQDYGIYAFSQPSLILVGAAASVMVFYFHRLTTGLPKLLDFMDNLSMSLWCIVSVGKGLSAGLSIVPAVILGFTTAVGGGVLRDIIMNKKPAAFTPGTLYGSAAIAGCVIYALLAQDESLKHLAAWACAIMVFALRYAALYFDWQTKPAKDYSDNIIKPVVAIGQHAAKPFSAVLHPERFEEEAPKTCGHDTLDNPTTGSPALDASEALVSEALTPKAASSDKPAPGASSAPAPDTPGEPASHLEAPSRP